MKWILRIFFVGMAGMLAGCAEESATSSETLEPRIVLIQVPAEVYQIPVKPAGIHVRAEDARGVQALSGVILTVQPENLAWSSDLAMADDGKRGDILAGDGQFFLPIDSALTRNDTGLFHLEAIAQSKDNLLSQPMAATFTLLPGNENRLPEIVSYTIPAVIWTDTTYSAQFLATVHDPDGDAVDFVLLDIHPPAYTQPAVIDTLRDDGQSGDGLAGDGEFGLLFESTRFGSAEGIFTVALRPVDNAGGIGPAVVENYAMRRFYVDNQPPELSDLTAPSTISRSATPNTYLLAVSASDPDAARGDRITRVFFNSFRPDGTPASGNPFQMRDDGMDGDDTAGDGRYSLIIQITPTNPTGNYRFEFQAQDNNGALSEKLIHTITVTQ